MIRPGDITCEDAPEGKTCETHDLKSPIAVALLAERVVSEDGIDICEDCHERLRFYLEASAALHRESVS